MKVHTKGIKIEGLLQEVALVLNLGLEDREEEILWIIRARVKKECGEI